MPFSINDATGEKVSVSTLKRLWNYVDYDHRTTLTVRSILSRYIAYKDCNDFINSGQLTDISGFIRRDMVKTENLPVDTEIIISWLPRRKCRLRYKGNEEFGVLESVNSKLKPGDTISCSLIAKGEPLYCTDVIRDSLPLGGYVAAKIRGINDIVVIHSKSNNEL